MPQTADVLVPPNAEGTRATVLRWCKAVGDTVAQDEPLLELETDKVTVEISSPATGELSEILKQPDEEVLPGQLLARVRIAESNTAAPPQEPAAGVRAPAEPLRVTEEDARLLLSPAVRKLLEEHGLSPADVTGSGRNGRITSQDVLRHVDETTSVHRVDTDSNARASGDEADPPGCIAVEDRARQEQRGSDGEKGDRRHVPGDVDHAPGRPRTTEASGRQRCRRELSHYKDLASHSVDDGTEDGQGSGDDQRDVHVKPSAIRAILWRKSRRSHPLKRLTVNSARRYAPVLGSFIQGTPSIQVCIDGKLRSSAALSTPCRTRY